jgi:hypothetical protein
MESVNVAMSSRHFSSPTRMRIIGRAAERSEASPNFTTPVRTRNPTLKQDAIKLLDSPEYKIAFTKVLGKPKNREESLYVTNFIREL